MSLQRGINLRALAEKMGQCSSAKVRGVCTEAVEFLPRSALPRSRVLKACKNEDSMSPFKTLSLPLPRSISNFKATLYDTHAGVC